MHIEKVFETDLERCYSAGVTRPGGKPLFLMGSELHGAILSYDPKTGKKEVVSEGPGGVMSMIPIPGKDGDFLAIQRFFPVYQSKDAEIAWYRRSENGWESKVVLKLPYLHRFDLFKVDGKVMFLGATLCTSKQETEDWRDPGKLYAGVLPESWEGEIKIQPIKENMLKNHGYCHVVKDGAEYGYATCNSGVYRITPPKTTDGEWHFEHLIERPISDVAVCDIDGDGEDELLLLEGFHGNAITINKMIDGKYAIVWEYKQKPIEFVHVAWGGRLGGVPAYIAGTRKLDGGIFIVTWNKESGVFEVQDIEVDTGPSNVCVLNGADGDLVLAANHRVNKAAVYAIK